MKEQFIPYDLAIKLKELGFDEICLGYYFKGDRFSTSMNNTMITKNSLVSNRPDNIVTAPLWQQAFDFFRKKYKLSSHCDLKSVNHLGENYYYKIINFADFIDDSTIIEKDGFNSIEEARLECLKKLILLVKNN